MRDKIKVKTDKSNWASVAIYGERVAVEWECCHSCRFWRSGKCHRNPPTLIDEMFGAWPETEDFEWCGSYEAVDYAE